MTYKAYTWKTSGLRPIGRTSMVSPQDRNKKVVRDFFKLVAQGRQKESLGFFAANCKQHNPYIAGGMEALFVAMSEVQQRPPEYPDPEFTAKRRLAGGDMVVAQVELLNSASKPDKGGLRQAHLFQFGKDDKVVEYRDITQLIQPDTPNPTNAFDRPSIPRKNTT